jgi:general stress protein 26
MQTTDYMKLAEVIKDIKFTMMTTIGPNGKLHTRPMATLEFKVEDFDGTLWFFTRIDTLKVHDILEDKEILLSYADPEGQRYVVINGLASIVHDKSKIAELWTPALKAWFPKGLKDEEIALIKVEVYFAEVWEAPPSKVVHAIGMAKAMITGKPYDQRANSQQIDLKHH